VPFFFVFSRSLNLIFPVCDVNAGVRFMREIVVNVCFAMFDNMLHELNSIWYWCEINSVVLTCVLWSK